MRAGLVCLALGVTVSACSADIPVPSARARLGGEGGGPATGGGGGSRPAGTGGAGGTAPEADSREAADDAADAASTANSAPLDVASTRPGVAPMRIVQSAKLPIVMLDVPGQATPDVLGNQPLKVPGRVRIIEDHDGTLMDLMGKTPNLDTPAGIELHGSSSRTFPQKSFNFETRDASMASKDFSVLGLPKGSDWALIACWNDKTCMRNALAYAMAGEFGRWAPRLLFVEVLYNNAYQGLYQLVEMIREDKYRVPIPKPVAGGDVTGGYIVHREASGKGSITINGKAYQRDWLSPVKAPGMYPHQIVYTFHSPREHNITAEQKTYITGFFARFETIMASAGWADPATGYRSVLDVPTAAEYVLMQELSNNVDGYWKSVYYTKPPDSAPGGGKMMLTPVWDFNLAFGNANYRQGWKANVSNLNVLSTFGGECMGTVKGPPVCDGLCCEAAAAMNTCKTKCWNMPIVAFYFERLWADTAFQNDVKCRWQDLRKASINMTFVDARIAEYNAALRPTAVPRHFAKWPALRGYVTPNPYVVDPSSAPVKTDSLEQFFTKETMWMRNWLDQRIKWLDANLPGTCKR